MRTAFIIKMSPRERCSNNHRNYQVISQRSWEGHYSPVSEKPLLPGVSWKNGPLEPGLSVVEGAALAPRNPGLQPLWWLPPEHGLGKGTASSRAATDRRKMGFSP